MNPRLVGGCSLCCFGVFAGAACILHAATGASCGLNQWLLVGLVYNGLPIAMGGICLAILAAGIRRARAADSPAGLVSAGVAGFVSILAVLIVGCSLILTLGDYLPM